MVFMPLPEMEQKYDNWQRVRKMRQNETQPATDNGLLSDEG